VVWSLAVHILINLTKGWDFCQKKNPEIPKTFESVSEIWVGHEGQPNLNDSVIAQRIIGCSTVNEVITVMVFRFQVFESEG